METIEFFLASVFIGIVVAGCIYTIYKIIKTGLKKIKEINKKFNQGDKDNG